MDMVAPSVYASGMTSVRSGLRWTAEKLGLVHPPMWSSTQGRTKPVAADNVPKNVERMVRRSGGLPDDMADGELEAELRRLRANNRGP
jgi:hypothetical protein